MGVGIHLGKPFRGKGDHLVHMLLIGAENNVLACPVFHMLAEDFIQAVRLFQRTAQGFQIFLSLVPDSLALGRADTLLILLQILLIGKHRQHIFRRVQDAPDDGFA